MKRHSLALFTLITISSINPTVAVKVGADAAKLERTTIRKSDLVPGQSLWRLTDFNHFWIGNSNGFIQENATQTGCATGEAASGDLGFSGTECHGCVISGKHIVGEPDMEFHSEPILRDIRAGGPAEGKLAEGDLLVALDDQPITTRIAAIQLSWLKPGEPVRLTIRRAGGLRDIEITPTARCRRLTPPRTFIIIRRRARV